MFLLENREKRLKSHRDQKTEYTDMEKKKTIKMFNKEKTELGLLIEKTVVGSFVGCRRIKKIVIHHYDYRLYTRTYFSGVSLSFSIGKLLRMKMRFNSGLKPYDFSPDTP